MDTAPRYSAGIIVESTSTEVAIYAMELTWLAHFWPPAWIHADGAFLSKHFMQFFGQYGIELRPVPPRRHQKNMIEPRYGSIWSIFLRLKHADSEIGDALHVIRAIRVSDDLSGSDTLSANEMAKGFGKCLVASQRPVSVDKTLCEAHDEPIAKRKLTLMLRSNTFDTGNFRQYDPVHV